MTVFKITLILVRNGTEEDSGGGGGPEEEEWEGRGGRGRKEGEDGHILHVGVSN